MKKIINLFVDMDGTIAKFYYKKNYLEKMYEKGYFENLPEYAMAKYINQLAKENTCINVYILSACIESKYCEQEKIAWLIKHMPNINPKNFIFTKVGEIKVDVATSKIENGCGGMINILLDDYTKNLNEWQVADNFIGFKFINGINDTTKNWQGVKIKTYKQLMSQLKDYAVYGITK